MRVGATTPKSATSASGQIPSPNFGITRDGTVYPGGKQTPSFMSRVSSKMGSMVKGLARGFGNPVSAGVMTAMEPTPANQGENEFARQAKYGATTKPAAATPTAKPTTATPAATKPVAAPAAAPKPAAAPAPAPKAAASPAPAAAKSSFYKSSQGDYTIKRGDTLSGIAKRTGQSVTDLAKMNKISDVNKISAGAKLATSVPTPPARPATTSAPAPAPKSDAVPGSSTGDVTPTAKPTAMAPEVGRSQTPAPAAPAPAPAEKPPEKKKEAGAVPPPAPMAESVVTVGANKYRIV